jgi:hypothetical protein
MSNRGEHAANLAISALEESDFQDTDFGVSLMDAHSRRSCFAVVKRDAIAEFLEHIRRGNAAHVDMVSFGNRVTWVGQLHGEFRIVREDQQSLGVRIEPANGKKPGQTFRQKIVDR